MLVRMSEQPQVRIVRGTPTAEELAALVGVLPLRPGTAAEAPPAPSRWARSAHPGARTGAWRASALPSY
jgi:hypothetical protein